jgi:integrase
MIFNELTLKGLPATGKRYVVTDESRPGLSIKVSATGRASYYFRGKKQGKRVEHPLPGTDFEQVLVLWRFYRAECDSHKAATTGPAPGDLFIEGDLHSLCEGFLEGYVRRKLSAASERNYRAQLNRLKDELEGTRLEVGQGTVAEARQAIRQLLKTVRDVERKPVLCNRMKSCYSSLFRWALEEELVSDSPMTNMPTGEEKPKDVMLEEHELQPYLAALTTGRFDKGTTTALRLILLNGLRPSEVLALTPFMVNLKKQRILLPGEITKNGKPLLIPLSSQSCQLLAPFMEGKTPMVPVMKTNRLFRTSTFGLRQVSKRAAKRAGVTRVSSHDLRRTFATLAGRIGIEPHIIGHLLNHSPGDVTSKHYLLYQYEDEKRTALQQIADYLETAGPLFNAA